MKRPVATGFAVALALAAALAGVSMLGAARAQQEFPHERHAGLFPLCTGCHLGVMTGEEADVYPPPESCAACHDGTREARVTWAGPTSRASNLVFTHPAHATEVAAEGMADLECAVCHTQPGAPRMRVEPPIPERCFGCHVHTATEHFVDAQCAVCHTPLAESGLPAGRIAALPVPPSHARPDFLAGAHGALAQVEIATCSVCHAQEQCTSCHVRIAPAAPIAEVPAALGRVAVPMPAARYPLPPSHLDPAWERVHGRVASPESCGTCHTRESCATCHAPPLPRVASALPRRADVAAPGVTLARTVPASHASPFFATQHGPLAAARPQSCATCHERASFCSACHEPGGGVAPMAAGPSPPYGGASPRALHGEFRPALATNADVPARVALAAFRPIASDTPPATPPVQPPPGAATTPRAPRGFHPPNYVLRHSAEAYGRRLDCASCHNTQLFCRDCHESSGRVATGRLGPGYHDAEPVWLLRHGQAARQTLESCTACHTQRDCMQCHSQLGAFRVSPHGPNFDARRAQRANPQICRACHLGDPLGG